MNKTAPFSRMKRVLVVDDDELFCELFATLLSTMPIVVKVCYEAVMAMSLIRSSNWDLIIVDQLLPNTSGFTLLDSVKKFSPGIKTAIVASFIDSTVLWKGDQAKIDFFVEKPVCFQSLRGVLNAIMDKDYVTGELERIESISLGELENVAQRTGRTRQTY